MQNHYNLLYREEEREMLPLCADQGVGVIPWSPLARGRLTRRLGRGHRAVARPTSSAGPSTTRTTGSSSTRVAEIAEARGVPAPRSRWPGCSATRR